MNAWMNEWTDEWLSESMNFADPIFQKCSETLRLLTIFLWNRALATVSCTYYRPRLPKVLQTRQFFAILCETELSPESRAHFPKPIFQKRSERLSFSTFSRYSLVQIEAATAETETLLRRPRKPFYRKKRRVSRPRMFSSLNSRAPDLLHFPTTWWWRGWLDDVVDMMVRMLPMTISEVF